MIEPISWKQGELYFIDQTRLPEELFEERQESVEQVWDSIKKLKVRGAPALGIAGAYGLLVGLEGKRDLPVEQFLDELDRLAEYLNGSRPTAVNLSWALKKMAGYGRACGAMNSEELYSLLAGEAVRIHEEDKALNRRIGEHGLSLIREGTGILTHCNAGALATSVLGTATSPMYLAHERGIRFRVFADETRPLLQGSRLTAWELNEAGIDVTVITDNMAAHMMKTGEIDLVIVGTDRVAANGDIANKIGTLGVAVSARYFGIPFYVACPYSTIDMATGSGDDIVIEERGPDEVTHFGLRRTAPVGIKVRNPAFDVTPCELVTGIITERGIITPPFDENLKKLYEIS